MEVGGDLSPEFIRKNLISDPSGGGSALALAVGL
jgi:hypothetical protein